MKWFSRAILIVMVTGVTAQPCISAAPPATQQKRPSAPPPLFPDERMQAQLARVSRAISEPEHLREIAAAIELKDQLAGTPGGLVKNDIDFIRQVLYHAAYGTAEHRLDRLWHMLHAEAVTEVSRGLVLEAVAPYLDSRNGRLRDAAGHLLSAGEAWELGYEDGRTPLFANIAGYPVDTPAELHHVLIRGMYRISPSAALRTMMNLEFRSRPEHAAFTNALLEADHQLVFHRHLSRVGPDDKWLPDPNAIGLLDELSKNRHWWVRLYVAAMIERHDELREDAIVRRLSQDENDLVKHWKGNGPATAQAGTEAPPATSNEAGPAQSQPLR